MVAFLYGITAPPGILNMALMAYSRLTGTDLSHEISNNLYVDNILLRPETERETPEDYRESKGLLENIIMNLREKSQTRKRRNVLGEYLRFCSVLETSFTFYCRPPAPEHPFSAEVHWSRPF